MSNSVLVLSSRRVPLMPCCPARARQLLKNGKAAIIRRYPFTIILKERSEGDLQPIELRIDPGSKVTGIALVGLFKRGDRCLFGLNLIHRGDAIREKIFLRSMYRRGRRSRKLRYRPKRFLNRRRPVGWLPPSVDHRVLTTITWIDRFTSLSPVTSSKCELVKFDVHRLMNPGVSGEGYQRGPLYGTEMREYLLEAYNRQCQYCLGASGDKYLQWEHKTPRKQGGSDSLTNATLSCGLCNRIKGNRTLHQFLKYLEGRKDKLSVIQYENIIRLTKVKTPVLRDSAVMNATRFKLRDYLEALGLNPIMSPGWVTKRNRLDQKYVKDHWIDAACVGGCPVYLNINHVPLTAKSMGHGSRQMVTNNKYGFPASAPKGPSSVGGFKTGDLVLLNKKDGMFIGKHIGRILIRRNGKHSIRKNGTMITSVYRKFIKLQSSDGYAYGNFNGITFVTRV